jgi:hypothetical protein
MVGLGRQLFPGKGDSTAAGLDVPVSTHLGNPRMLLKWHGRDLNSRP